jgi:TonB family protein
METLAPGESASQITEPEPNLLLQRDHLDDWRRWRSAAIYSAIAHVVLIIGLLLAPASGTRVYQDAPRPEIHVVHLYTPTDLTQKAPNKSPLSKELTVQAIPPHPEIKAPTPAPAAKKASPPIPFPPPPRVAKNEPKPVEPPSAPKIEGPQTQQEQIANLNLPPPPPPPAQQPKLVLENATAPPPAGNKQASKGTITMPDTSVEAAVRSLSQSGGALGNQSVGDTSDQPGIGAGLNLPPSAGQPHSNLELRSDPMGVDFRPYMIQVLAAVRRNWFAVYPAAAKAGMRGEVVLEFAIAKQGSVNKVIFAGQSGARPLDEAAVAAISASNPLPPLPSAFRGDRIVLRMTFKYNMPR